MKKILSEDVAPFLSNYYTATGKGYEARKKVHENLPIWDCR